MLKYHAAYYPIEGGWFMARVLDFPGAVSQGRTLRSARRMIRDSLRGLAEFVVEKGESLPLPNAKAKDDKAVFMETLDVTFRCVLGSSDEATKTHAASARKRVRLRSRGRKTYNGAQPGDESAKPRSAASRD